MEARTRDVAVGFLSTYPPTLCGLATFTSSLVHAIAGVRESRERLGVVRLIDSWEETPSIQSRVHVHRRGDPVSLRNGIEVLNTYDAVSVQHEFGIFGGLDGAEVIDVVSGLEVPVATTFHTVLDAPTGHQRSIVERLAAASRRAIVMSSTAAQRLTRHYDVDPERVLIIPHGADARFGGPPLPVGARPLVLTWGLIGPGKGLEVAIEACLELVGLVPRPRYLIAGATHPNVRRTDGESYREGLMALVRRLDLEAVVEFDDRYLDAETLARLVRSADLVVLPYTSVDQVTSGVLVEALSASKPVIATPFPHSLELLADGAGTVVPHDDAPALGAAMREVLTDPQVAYRMTRAAHRLAQGWLWPAIGRHYERMFTQLATPRSPQRGPVKGHRAAHHAA